MATWFSHSDHVKQMSARLGRPHAHVVDRPLAFAAMERLRVRGAIRIPAFCRFTDMKAQEYLDSPWSQDTPLDHVFRFRTDDVQPSAAAAPQMAMTNGGAAAAEASEPFEGRVRLFGRIMKGLDNTD